MKWKEMKRKKEKNEYVYTRPTLRPKYEYGTIKHSANEYWISLFYILCCSFVVKGKGGGGGLVVCVCMLSLIFLSVYPIPSLHHTWMSPHAGGYVSSPTTTWIGSIRDRCVRAESLPLRMRLKQKGLDSHTKRSLRYKQGELAHTQTHLQLSPRTAAARHHQLASRVYLFH